MKFSSSTIRKFLTELNFLRIVLYFDKLFDWQMVILSATDIDVESRILPRLAPHVLPIVTPNAALRHTLTLQSEYPANFAFPPSERRAIQYLQGAN
jgi:hypothetical protein